MIKNLNHYISRINSPPLPQFRSRNYPSTVTIDPDHKKTVKDAALKNGGLFSIKLSIIFKQKLTIYFVKNIHKASNLYYYLSTRQHSGEYFTETLWKSIQNLDNCVDAQIHLITISDKDDTIFAAFPVFWDMS